MKFYPYPKSPGRPDGGFLLEEVKDGSFFLRSDVECTQCGKIMSLANAGSTDNGNCIRCGGRTS